MSKRRTFISLFTGFGFASLLLLLLNLPLSIMQMFIIMLLSPGGALVNLLITSDAFESPFLILVVNGFVYSIVTYVVLSVIRIQANKTDRVVYTLIAPAVILVCLASIPALNPLWPHGMAELIQQEKELHESLVLGMSMEQVPNILRSEGAQPSQFAPTSEAVVLERGDKKILVAVGDRALSARLETNANQFPCGYQVEIFLVFGEDQRMKQRYIERLRICP